MPYKNRTTKSPRVINVGNMLFLWINTLSLPTLSSDLIQTLVESNLKEREREAAARVIKYLFSK